MRDIKFRCWNDHSKIMHEWAELVEKNKIHLLANQKPSYKIMQFTGLKDMSGVEIFEGDIIKWGHIENYIELSGTRFAVVDMSIPSDGVALACYSPMKKRFKLGSFAYAKCTEKCVEVLGNIHQNPELLELP